MAGPGSARMIGRADQLETVRRLASMAAARTPGVAVVLGEAGIGKTRLVDELTEGLTRDRTLVVRGCCSPGAARDLPLVPVVDVLLDLHRSLGTGFGRVTRGREATLARLAPELGPVLTTDPGGPAAEPSRTQVFGAVVGLLRDVARTRPLVVVVEDVHWADETSRDLLDYLARSVRDERLLLLVTARTDDPAYEEARELLAGLASLRHATRVEIPRLTNAEVAEQVAQLRAGAPLPHADLERIAAVTEGVPMLVEELVDADLGEVGVLADRLLGHRLSRLSPPARTVVESAALAVLDPSPSDLAAASPLAPGDFDAGFSDAITGGVLVRSSRTVAFRHALLREAVLARVLPHTRRDLHRRWSAVIGDRPSGLAETVAAAHHRHEAGELGPALDAFLLAADLADGVSAYAEQMRMLERAADLWPRVPDAADRTGTELFSVLAGAAWAALLSVGRLEQSQRLVDAAREALPADAAPAERAMLDLLWNRTRWKGGDRLTTEEVLAAVAEVPLDPPREHAVLACLEAVQALLHAADPKSAEAYARRAVDVADRTGDIRLVARALATLAQVQSGLGDDEAALRSANRSVALAERSDDLFGHQESLAILDLVQWSAGEDGLATNTRLVELLGGDRPGPLPGAWGMASANRAEGLIDAGRWDEAQEVLDRVLAEDLPDYVFWAAWRLFDHLAVWRGGDLPARTADMPASPRRESLDNTHLEDLLAVGYTYGDIAGRRGDPVAARRRTRAAIADDRATSNPGMLFPLLWVAARTEADARLSGTDPTPDEGDWFVGRIQHLLDVMPARNPRDRAYAAHVRAHLARRTGDEDVETWAVVVDLWRHVDLPHPLGWALVSAGAAAARAGLRTEARRALREAIDIGERLGAPPLVGEALATGRRAHLRLSSATPREVADLGLTDRELDVLRLVAEGASNAAIARALSISTKTASVHVSHILAKLGVASRGEAAALAHRAGAVVG